MTERPSHTSQFYLTAPSPCPYLRGQEERKVFTHLGGERASELNDILTQGGFRRSQNIAYRPACERCRACMSVRVVVSEFEANKSMQRIVRKNNDIIVQERPAEASSEQYDLFRTYLDNRHPGGGMSDMSVLDYASMVEESEVETRVFEFRQRDTDSGITGRSRKPLIAVALSDVLSDGLSMVYSYFDPSEAARSLGTFMILEHLERAQRMGLPYLYLGYLVEGSPKMAYKGRFQPQERLGNRGWVRG
ncbi:MAG: arginyltransferase [Alphaproteobacteria bacterium]|nr:arginyltransferase [Alphaproteobacteria bacterium]